jgi:hypothetical protein
MDYEDENYVSSKFYYDSTMSNMLKTDTAYAGVESRDKTLDKLVKQINIITTEDSLQRIAALSPADRIKFIQKLLDKKQQEADEKQAEKDRGKSGNTDFIKPGGANATPTVLDHPLRLSISIILWRVAMAIMSLSRSGDAVSWRTTGVEKIRPLIQRQLMWIQPRRNQQRRTARP